MKQALIFDNLFDGGDSFWVTGLEYNALFRIEKKSWKIELIGIFPGEKFIQRSLYISTAVCNGKFYFAPYSAGQIAEYDPEKDRFKKIPVKEPCKQNDMIWNKGKFSGVETIEGKIYFIPAYYPGILCYDANNGYSYCIDDWIEKIEKNRTGEWGYFIDFQVVGHKIILPCACADAIVIFDTIEQSSQVFLTPPTQYLCKYCGICYTDGFFYLLSADGVISKRSLKSEKEEVQVIRLPAAGCDEIEYYPMQYINGYIYVFPYRKNSGVQIDTNTDQVMCTGIFDDEKDFIGSNFLFLTSKTDGEKIYTSAGNSHRFIEYDVFNGNKRERLLYPSKQEQYYLAEKRRKEFIKRACEDGVLETESDSLTYMLEVIDRNYDASEKSHVEKKEGKWEKIIKLSENEN